MPIINRADGSSEAFLPQYLIDFLAKLFIVGLIVLVASFGYLVYGLFSGALAAASQTHEVRLHAIQLVTSTSSVVNVSLIVTLVCAVLLYYENEALAIILLLVAAFLAFGLNFLLDFVAGGQNLTAGDAAKNTLQEIKLVGEIIGVPGVLLFYGISYSGSAMLVPGRI